MGKKIYFDTQELEVITKIVDDDIETSEAYQENLEADGQGCLFADTDELGQSTMMTEAVVREEVAKRIKIKLEGGE